MPGIEHALGERNYYDHAKQWPVAEAGLSAVTMRQAGMPLTTGSLWSECHQCKQTDMSKTGTRRYGHLVTSAV